ncbi:MAG: LamG domain-containing protein, partial [Candidatus Diapherotrites archaeon]
YCCSGEWQAGFCDSSCVPSTEICDNGTDEDCDGLIDCADTANCSGNPACASCTPTTEICNDGTDNDCDNLVDCNDPDCGGDSACNASTGLLNGLVSYWNFDSGASDVHNGNDATVNGATSATGILNNGYGFDGDDFILTGDTEIGGDNYTFAAWVYNSGASASIVQAGAGNAQYFETNGANIQLGVGNGSSRITRITSGNRLTPNGWHHIAATWEMTADRTVLYVDGIPETFSNIGFTGSTYWGDGVITMGRTYYASKFFTGTMDEVGVWNRALTAEEISSLYNSGSGLAYPFGGASCSEEWSCTGWGECVDGMQTRSCSDPNPSTIGCPETPVPPETQGCSTLEGVIFEDDFDSFTRDYECDNSYACEKPDSYDLFKSHGGDYGKPNGQIINEADRFGGQGENRGYRICLEEDVFPARDTQLEVTLTHPQEVMYFRWYGRESTLQFTNYQKLFRIFTASYNNILTIGWKHKTLPGEPIWLYLFNTNTADNILFTDFDLGTDIIPGDWHCYELLVDLNSKTTEFWVNGITRGRITERSFPDDWSIGIVAIGGNQYGHDWVEPVEYTRDYDDVVFSTEYIGPAFCLDTDRISVERGGACYCGNGSPSPTSAAGIYSSGYCISRQHYEPDVFVNSSGGCSIDATNGVVNNCSQNNLIYEFENTGIAENLIANLMVNNNYNVKIENLTAGTTQNKTANSNSSGVLEFSS